MPEHTPPRSSRPATPSDAPTAEKPPGSFRDVALIVTHDAESGAVTRSQSFALLSAAIEAARDAAVRWSHFNAACYVTEGTLGKVFECHCADGLLVTTERVLAEPRWIDEVRDDAERQAHGYPTGLWSLRRQWDGMPDAARDRQRAELRSQGLGSWVETLDTGEPPAALQRQLDDNSRRWLCGLG